MAETVVKATGLRELGEALRALPAEVASKRGGPLARALREAANVIKDDAVSRAPVSHDPKQDPGRLKRNIITKRDPKPGNVNERMVVMVRRGRNKDDPKGARYFRFPEFGTEKQAPHPFLRPAFDSQATRALEVFKTSLSKGIDRAARKAAKLGLRGRG